MIWLKELENDNKLLAGGRSSRATSWGTIAFEAVRTTWLPVPRMATTIRIRVRPMVCARMRPDNAATTTPSATLVTIKIRRRSHRST